LSGVAAIRLVGLKDEGHGCGHWRSVILNDTAGGAPGE
jgi:hypothetical protein